MLHPEESSALSTGQKFVDEACRSAASVKRCMPDVPITIFSDVPIGSIIFEQVVPITNPTYGPEDKIVNIAKSPYQDTLYLDSDTHMVDDSRELFSLLERFDLAAAHAPYRAQCQVCEVPECFPELMRVSFFSGNRNQQNYSLSDGYKFIERTD